MKTESDCLLIGTEYVTHPMITYPPGPRHPLAVIEDSTVTASLSYLLLEVEKSKFQVPCLLNGSMEEMEKVKGLRVRITREGNYVSMY